MLSTLRNAINNGKTSNEVVSVTIKYSIENFDNLLVDHPTLQDAKVLKNTYITKNIFDVEVANAFMQWQLLFNVMYGEYIACKFIKAESDADIKIKFSNISSPLEASISNYSLTLKSGLNWASSVMPIGEYLLLNHLVYNIGLLLRVAPTSKVTPMSTKFLKSFYPSVSLLTVSEDGSITNKSILEDYPIIKDSILNIYGVNFSRLPYILGCTDPKATNFDPTATIEDGSCFVEMDTSFLQRMPRSDANYAVDITHNEYAVMSSQKVYAFQPGVFNTDQNIGTQIQNSSGANIALFPNIEDNNGQLHSLVITDKGGNGAGDIRYYVFINNYGDISIHNIHGDKLSDLISLPTGETSILNPFHSSAFKISYAQQTSDKHVLSWYDNLGGLKQITLDDTLVQYSNDGTVVTYCDSDTLAYGNAEGTVKSFQFAYQYKNSAGTPLSVSNEGKIETESGRNYPALVYPKITWDNALGPNEYLIAALDSVNQLAFRDFSTYNHNNSIKSFKSFTIPTYAGPVHANLDPSAALVRLFRTTATATGLAHPSIGEIEQVSCVYGDSEIDDNFEFTASYPQENFLHQTQINNNTNSARNTFFDVNPDFFNQGNTALLRPFSTGFSFDLSNFSSSIVKTWSSTTNKFTGAPSRTLDINTYRQAPVTIGNKLFYNSYFADKTKVSFLATAKLNMIDSFGLTDSFLLSDENFTNSIQVGEFNHIGDFHLAIAVPHGILLTKINNTNFSIISPTTEQGLEVHIPGGDPNMANFSGGWTPISMEFSPNDTFLYTIIQNPNDSADRKIAIYNIHEGENNTGCTEPVGENGITLSVEVIEDAFDGDLEKITLQSDGAIYIWSSGGQYHKISSPDLYESVQYFVSNPQAFDVTLDYLPTTFYKDSILDIDKLGKVPTTEMQDVEGEDRRLIYSSIPAFNSSVNTIGAGDVVPPIINNSYNAQIVAAGITYDSVTHQVIPNGLPSDILPLTNATQTSDGESNGMILYTYGSFEERVRIHGEDNSVITTLSPNSIGGSGLVKYNKALDTQNSSFIIPLAGQEYFCAAFQTLGGAGIGVGGVVGYKYKIISANGSPGNIQYTHTEFGNFLGDNYINENRMTFPGVEVFNSTALKRVFICTSDLMETVESRNNDSRNIYLYYNDIVGVSSSKVENLQEYDLAKEQLVHEVSNFNIGDREDIVTTMRISRDGGYIVIATAITSEEFNNEITISAFKFTPNSDQPLGDQIGNSIKLTTNDFLVKEGINPNEDGAKMQHAIIRGIEFSPDNSKVYILVGKHRINSSVFSQNSFGTLENGHASSRIIRLELNEERGNGVFQFNGALTESAQYTNQSLFSYDSLFTFQSNGSSHQGDLTYRNNSTMTGLYRSSNNNIFISNTHPQQINSEAVVFMTGLITDPNSANDSSLHRNARVLTIAQGARDGGDWHAGQFAGDDNSSNSWHWQDFDGSVGSTPPSPATTAGNDIETDQNDTSFGGYGHGQLVYGCTEPAADNYNQYATIDNGSCVYYDYMGGITPEDAAECDSAMCPPLAGVGSASQGLAGIQFYQIPAVIGMINNALIAQVGAACAGNLLQDFSLVNPNEDAAYLPDTLIPNATCYNNPACDCQAYYKIDLAVVYNHQTETITAAPYAGGHGSVDDGCPNNITIQESFYFIPIKYQDDNGTWLPILNNAGTTAYPGEIVDADAESGWCTHIGVNPSNFGPWLTFDFSYCQYCLDQNGPLFDTYGTTDSPEDYPGWVVENNAMCGDGACIGNPLACNYVPELVDSPYIFDEGCDVSPTDVYEDIYGNPIDLGEICECGAAGSSDYTHPTFAAGFETEYCGDCSSDEVTDPNDPGYIYLKPESCNCQNNLEPFFNNAGAQQGYYCNCDGLEPVGAEYGCYCDANGLQQEPNGGFSDPEICDCDGTDSTTAFGPFCNCDGELSYNSYSSTTCDCQTEALLHYYDPNQDIEGIPCDAERVRICEITDSAKLHHPGMAGLTNGDYFNITNNTPITAGDYNTYYTVSGPGGTPFDYGQCEECATDEGIAAAGFEGVQEYDCAGTCKYRVRSQQMYNHVLAVASSPIASDQQQSALQQINSGIQPGDVFLNTNFGNDAENECGECLSAAQALEPCCEGDTFPEYTDFCGSCLATIRNEEGQLLPGYISVDISSGLVQTIYTLSYQVEGLSNVTPFITTCNPCANAGELGNSVGIQPAQQYTYQEFLQLQALFTPNDCGDCGGESILDLANTPGAMQGFYQIQDYAGGGTLYNCECDADAHPLSYWAAQPNENRCCTNRGFKYDPCSYDNGGCRPADFLHPDGTAVDDYDTKLDCAGECKELINDEWVGLNETDECGGCGPAGVRQPLSEGECCEGEVLGCDGNCYLPGNQPLLDDCGTCHTIPGEFPINGCFGCTDNTAVNYNPDATEDDGSCMHSSLGLSLADIAISTSGPIAYVEEAYFIGTPTANLGYINEHKHSFPQFNHSFNAFLYYDQPYYTTKCQVISFGSRTQGSTVLQLRNPANNAELIYTYSQGQPGASSLNVGEPLVANASYDTLSSFNAGDPDIYSARYYFRIDPTVILNTYSVAEIFAGYESQILSITAADGSQYLPDIAGIANIDGIGQLQKGVNPISPVTNPGEINQTTGEPVNSFSVDVDHVYQVIPRLNPENGHPFEISIDFNQFVQGVNTYGCTNELATNFNPNANVDDGSCTYTDVVDVNNITILGNPSNPVNLKWVICDSNSNIIQSNFGLYPADFSTAGHYTTVLPEGNCLYFVPIGFKAVEEWKKVVLLIRKNDVALSVLSYGIDSNNPNNLGGTQLLSYDDSCRLGCEPEVNGRINTDHCIANVKKDVKEFTQIDFTFEIGKNITTATSFLIQIYNLDNGNILFQTSDEYIMGESYSNSFSIDKETRIGIRIKNSEQLPVKFSLVSEYGEKVLSREYTRAYSTFDTITINPRIYGCTDSTAANYNIDATVDDGTCFDGAFEQCVKDALLSVSLMDCETKEAERALKLYALYDGYKQAVMENNQTKIDRYIEQLTNLCNAEHCESC
tara:strand:+ start:11139 stop:20198 length:9060 start_codon:yes stop_codon:yes gene_type:complete